MVGHPRRMGVAVHNIWGLPVISAKPPLRAGRASTEDIFPQQRSFQCACQLSVMKVVTKRGPASEQHCSQHHGPTQGERQCM